MLAIHWGDVCNIGWFGVNSKENYQKKFPVCDTMKKN